MRRTQPNTAGFKEGERAQKPKKIEKAPGTGKGNKIDSPLEPSERMQTHPQFDDGTVTLSPIRFLIFRIVGS